MVDDETILREVERNRADLTSGGEGARPRREQGRRRGQHHRRLLRDRAATRTRARSRAHRSRCRRSRTTTRTRSTSTTACPPVAVDDGRDDERPRGAGRRAASRCSRCVAGRRASAAAPSGASGARTSSAPRRDGHVAVYQGLPWNVVGSVKLYRARLRQPAARRAAEPGRAPAAVRPLPAQRRLGAAPPCAATRSRSEPDEPAEPRAREPRRRRRAHRSRVRQRLHRAAGRSSRPPRSRTPPSSSRSTSPRTSSPALTVPYADPYLLPMAGAPDRRSALTEIYRLNPSDAFRQGLWIVVALAAFARDALPAARRLPAARELQVPLRRSRAIGLLDAAGAARARHDRQRRAALGPRRLAPVPAGRAREDLPDRLPRRLPAREARGAGPGTAEGLRAAAR